MILLNGIETGWEVGFNDPKRGPDNSTAFESFYSFSIDTGFLPGINQLTFKVINGGTPTGLLVAGISGEASAVPEPLPVALLTIGLLAICITRTKRRLLSR